MQVRGLAAAKLDGANMALMKHSLYRLSTSAAANTGIPQYGWGFHANRLKNVLVDIATVSLMSYQAPPPSPSLEALPVSAPPAVAEQ